MIFVRYKMMELCVRGFTVVDDEGNYNIYLNSYYCHAQLQKTLQHELKHIYNGDFECGTSARIIERCVEQ